LSKITGGRHNRAARRDYRNSFAPLEERNQYAVRQGCNRGEGKNFVSQDASEVPRCEIEEVKDGDEEARANNMK